MLEHDIPPVLNAHIEYWRNRCKDGSRPKIVSKEMLIPWCSTDTPPGEPAFKPEDPWQAEAETLNEKAQREHLQRLQLCVDFHQQMLKAGLAQLQANATSEAKVAQEREPAPEPAPAPEPEPAPEPAPASAPAPAPAPKRVRLANPQIKPLSILTLAARSAKELPKASAELLQAQLKHNRVAADAQMRRDFMLDRAVAIVTDTMMHMDDTFKEVGFGNWMPFRFPDQWLMFGGLMQRVLAAHGLMHADTPEAYKRLLEETPPITEIAEGALIPPQSIGQGFRARELPTFKALIARIMDIRANRGPPK
ncbi:MAG: hypothetical protein IPP14_13265 [Planctomycetes bacterium]|nr:hypothetical protein [Planctomycetota bacterium]